MPFVVHPLDELLPPPGGSSPLDELAPLVPLDDEEPLVPLAPEDEDEVDEEELEELVDVPPSVPPPIMQLAATRSSNVSHSASRAFAAAEPHAVATSYFPQPFLSATAALMHAFRSFWFVHAGADCLRGRRSRCTAPTAESPGHTRRFRLARARSTRRSW